MKIIKMSQRLRCEYTDLELDEKRDELSEAVIKAGEVEGTKADAAKHFKDQLDILYARSAELSQQIKARGEHRLVDCAVEMNKPNVGEKTVIRLDTGEMVEIKVMTDDERQEEIEFGVEENRDIEKLINEAHRPEDGPPTDAPEAA